MTPSAKAHASVKYNVRRGCSNRNNTSFTLNTSDVCARYRKKLRAVLRKNKFLAQALEAAKAKINELESASTRQRKIDSLALPQVKSWLEMGAQQMHTAVNNHARALRLLEDIMTPGLDITLVGLTDPDDSGTQNRRRSLHPPGSQCYDEFGNISVIPEEDEIMDESQQGLLDTTLVNLDDDPGSKVTVRRKTRSTRSGHDASFLEEPPSIFEDPEVPTFKVVDEQASLLLAEVTGQEKKVVCATSVVLPPADKVKGPSVHEYSAAFSYRPKIPRTPSNMDKESTGFFNVEDVSGSPSLTRTRQRVSDIPLQPWPRKSVGNARSTRRSSLPVTAGPSSDETPPQEAQQSDSHVARRSSRLSELRLSDFDLGFMESPAITAPPQSSDTSPKKKPAFAAPKDSPNKAKAARQKSYKKLQVSGGSGVSRLTFVVSKPAEETEEGVTGDVLSSTSSTSAPSSANSGNRRSSKQLAAKKSGGNARSSELEPPRLSGTLSKSEPMDVSGSSSPDEDGAPRTSSGRASRRAAKAKSYKEPSLHVKLRRP
ncbi:uncharacterized protein LOC144120969 isoform X2 [Amblyomma americanum]